MAFYRLQGVRFRGTLCSSPIYSHHPCPVLHQHHPCVIVNRARAIKATGMVHCGLVWCQMMAFSCLLAGPSLLPRSEDTGDSGGDVLAASVRPV